MKITIGKPARGEKFFKRPDLRRDLVEIIEEEANILISAPRRVGKTSVLMDLFDNPIKNYIVVYADTEAVDDIDEFFEKILKELLDIDLLERYTEKLKKGVIEKFFDFSKTIKKINIPVAGEVEFDHEEKEDLSAHDQLIEFLRETDFKGNRILMLIDEFPVTIENIYKRSGLQATKTFLQTNRAIRLNPKLGDKIQFIYTGSIGLVNVLKRLGITEDINDLYEFFVPPLSQKEGFKFLSSILKAYDIKVSRNIINYALDTVEWRIPFYIQSFAREIRSLYRKEKPESIDKLFIDRALSNVIENVNIYLDHYRSRLQKTFKTNELSFVVDVLNTLANDEGLDENHLPEKAAEYEVLKEYKYIMDTLVYDGYINNDNEVKAYKFNSPIMKLWWRKYGN